jgi:biotin carboxylase
MWLHRAMPAQLNGSAAPQALGPRRLLVVGANRTRDAAFAVWRSMGLELVLVDGHSDARYEQLTHEFFALDARDGSQDEVTITELARGCDGITTLADESQAMVAAIADEVGLPGLGTEAGKAARSKTLQRSLCASAGMQVPRWRTVRGVDDLEDFFADGPRPAVLKPIDAAGGSGAMPVMSLDDAAREWRVVRVFSPARTGIIEDFLEGREVCVDAVVVDGRPAFVSITDAGHLGTGGFVLTSHSWAAEQPEHDAAERAIEQLAGALGFSRGMVHAEFKIQDGCWQMLETALRPGGAFIPELSWRVTGVDLYEAQARLALDEDPPLPALREPSAAFAQARFLIAEGQVKRFVAPAKILADLPDVKVVNQESHTGQRVRVPLSDGGRAAYAYGWGDDRDSLDAQLREALERLGREMGLTVHAEAPDRHPVAA